MGFFPSYGLSFLFQCVLLENISPDLLHVFAVKLFLVNFPIFPENGDYESMPFL